MCYYLGNDKKCSECEYYDEDCQDGEYVCGFELNFYRENEKIAEGFYD